MNMIRKDEETQRVRPTRFIKMVTNRMSLILPLVCLSAPAWGMRTGMAPEYDEGPHQTVDTVLYDRALTTQEVAEKDFFVWLSENDTDIKGNVKRMSDIRDFIDLVVDELKNPQINISSFPSEHALKDPGERWQQESEAYFRRSATEYEVRNYDAAYYKNLDIVRKAPQLVFREGFSYGKRPIVWFVNDEYIMTTGYGKKGWKYTKGTLDTECDGDEAGDIDALRLPEKLSDVKSVRLSEATEKLHTCFYPGSSIFNEAPVLIYIEK